MKKAITVVVILVSVYLLMAFMAKPVYKIERKMVIMAPPEILSPLLCNHKIFHETWSPWAKKDTAMYVKFSGTPGEPGHKMEWSSELDAVGTGTMELLRLSSDTIVESLVFEGMQPAPYYYIAKPAGAGLELTIGLILKPPFLMKPLLMMMGDPDQEIGADFEEGLISLKKRAEDAQKELESMYKIAELEWPESNFVGTDFDTLEISRIGGFFSKNLPLIGEAMIKKNIEPKSAPMAIYKFVDEEKGVAVIAAVSRVETGIKLPGFINHQFPTGKVLATEHYGDYNNLALAHASIDKYMSNRNLSSQMMFEEYVTDPAAQPDTSKWLTRVYYLLK